MKNLLVTSNEDDLPPLVVEFLDYLITVRGKSINTVNAYKIDLSLFFKFMKHHKKIDTAEKEVDNIRIHDVGMDLISSINTSDIYAFINYITIIRHNGPHARARKTASIKSFYNYITRKAKLIDMNPVANLETPKIIRKQQDCLTIEETGELLNSVDGIYKERDCAIITLFLNCGLKLSELVSLDITDLKGDTLILTKKGNQDRVVYLNKACKDALKEYMKVRANNNMDINALFLSERKRRISKRTVQYIVEKSLQKANLNGKKYSAQKLKYTAAAHYIEDINTLQKVLSRNIEYGK